MSDKEKFEGFKRDLIEENERRYGAEVRQKYGGQAVDASNEKMRAMGGGDYKDVQELEAHLARRLKEAAATGDPASHIAQSVCELHKKWLCMYWPHGMYSKEAHLALGEMYVEDPRFREYYDAICPGGAKFLHDALIIFCSQR